MCVVECVCGVLWWCDENLKVLRLVRARVAFEWCVCDDGDGEDVMMCDV